MRKILILSTPIFIALFFIGINVKAQNTKDIENRIIKANSDFTKRFNAGQIDSLGMLYHQNASLILDNLFPVINNNLPAVIGKESILSYYKLYYSQNIHFSERKSKKMVYGDSIILDIGILKIKNDSITKSGTYFCQWKYDKGNWLIENEMLNFK